MLTVGVCEIRLRRWSSDMNMPNINGRYDSARFDHGALKQPRGEFKSGTEMDLFSHQQIR